MGEAERRLRGRLGRFLRDRWFSIDLRTLGLFRIAFGLCLIGSLLDHVWNGNLAAFFSNEGVLTNHFALFAPIQPRIWSLLFAFSAPGEVALAFAAIFFVYVLFTIGWKTKLMQLLVIVCFVSIVNRNLLLQDGGVFVTTILAVWTVFLPLGARFSVDRCLARRRAARAADSSVSASVLPSTPGSDTAAERPFLPDTRSERHVSFVCFAILVQLAVIYAFNAANKSGPTWRDGTAVHYILWQNRMNTGLAAFLRFHEPWWFSPALTKATLIFESTAPFLVLAPFFQTWARRVLIAEMWLFHIGIASLLSIGPFCYVMMVYSLLLLGRRDWDYLESVSKRWNRARQRIGIVSGRAPLWMQTPGDRRPPDARPVASPPRSDDAGAGGVPHFFRFRRAARIGSEALAMLLFIAMSAELSLANPCIPPRFQMEARPPWMGALLHYMRIYQTWGMFSADAPLDDGVVVVDAVLADGSHIDPLTDRAPDFDAFSHGPWYPGHDWSEYMSYIPWERHRAHRDGLLQYVLRRQESRQPARGKEIHSVDIIWLSAQSPSPGEHSPHDIKREVLISYVAPEIAATRKPTHTQPATTALVSGD